MDLRWVAALAVVLAACGGGDSGGDGPGASELEGAVRSYSTAFIAGDGASARSQLTARCEERIGDLVESGATTIAEQYPGATMTSYEADVDGGAATVTYTFDQPGIDQADERWVVEGGEWRYDDC